MMNLLTRAAAVATLASLFCAAGCGTPPPRTDRPAAPATAPTSAPALHRFEYEQLHMGVRARVVLYAPAERAAEDAARAAFRRVAQLDDVASDYRKTSEAMRLCASAGGQPLAVSEDLFRLLDYSCRVAEASDGAFDPTVGPLVALWRSARKSGRLPDAPEIEATRKLVGWRKIKLDPQNRTAQLLVPGMKLDFGGIAKGYAGDCAIATLKEHGVRSALFEAGGDIVVSDPPPGRDGWSIDILTEKGERVVTIRNCAMASSGDTAQYVVIAGRRYSHVVDPRTGLGLTSRTMTTVLAPTGLLADPLATACGVMGPQGAAVLEKAFPGTKILAFKAPAE